MSQAGALGISGGGGGGPIIEIDTQNGNATPVAGIIIMNGEESTVNNANGIETRGGVAGTGVQQEVDIVLTNRGTGAVTTTDATPTTIISFALSASPGTYTITGSISAYNSTTPSGGAYTFVAGVRTDGATATVIGVKVSDEFEEAAMAASDISITSSGNDFLIQVTGLPAVTNISWFAQFNYTFTG